MVNDQIIAVDGVPLSGFTNQEAVEILKKTGAVVQLSVVRFLRGLKFEELQVGIDQVWPLNTFIFWLLFLLAGQINALPPGHFQVWCAIGAEVLDKDCFITLDRDLLKRANFFDNLSPLFKFELL